jgi:cytoskeletal protein RodZ
MSFLVYFFVLLVAAGSVIFGLDWTQAPLNPPPYAKLPEHASAVAPAPKSTTAAATKAAPQTTASVPQARGAAATASVTKPAAASEEAKQAQARATDASDATNAAETTAAAAHCNIAACTASYHSFRASDCTYQPYDGPRRICTKTSVPARTVATHPRRVRQDERRLTDRRDYPDQDRGWTFDLFGGGDFER